MGRKKGKGRITYAKKGKEGEGEEGRKEGRGGAGRKG